MKLKTRELKRFLKSIKTHTVGNEFDAYIVAKECGFTIYKVYNLVVELREIIPELPEPVERIHV